jgi:hypothetical protein
MALIIDHTLEIDAPLATAWQVLIDLERYRDWNPFVVECRSTLIPGAPIDMQVELGAAQPRPQRETIFEHRPQQFLSYGINAPLGALRSRRSHEFTALAPQRTLYKSKFNLGGWLSPIVALSLEKNLRRGFEGMSNALKARAESLR